MPGCSCGDPSCDGGYDAYDDYEQYESEYGNDNSLAGLVKEYYYKPETVFYREDPTEETTIFLGVELEIGVQDDAYFTTTESVMKLINTPAIYLKHDSSIHDGKGLYDYGLEIVTHPFNQAYYTRKIKWWDELLTTLAANGCKSGTELNAGIHIHVSRSAFKNTNHLYRFMRLFYENKTFTLWLSNRTPRKLVEWAHLEEPLIKVARKVIRDKQQIKDGVRRVAINLEPDHTIEVRIFNGTLVPLYFHSNIQAIFAAIHFTREEQTKNVTADRFIKWVQHRATEYPHLLERMQEWSTKKAL